MLSFGIQGLRGFRVEALNPKPSVEGTEFRVAGFRGSGFAVA